MIEIIKAIIFGIVEGITEWLPISSTGHLILFEKIFAFKNVSEGFWSMFEVVIQLGAILAVVVLFWNSIFPFTNKNGRGFKESGILSHLDKEITTLWFKIIVACIPAVIFVVLGLDDVCEAMFYNYFCVAIALIVFGVAFIVVENWNKNRTSKINSLGEITYQTALMIGLFQLIAAVFPGTSRSGATIVGALLIGVSRTVAAEYTFFLAIPVMFGASLLKIVKFGFNFTAMEAALLIIGMAAAFVVSLFVIRFLMGYIKKHDFKVFGWYRIILGAIVLLLRP
ncbi:undecaprenyl-diphosphate phosphatase [[Bacteroides] pectinophilus]|uniref:Undecaprenyl-diphosphatase n=1 Tax=[Bacteroides] pectinophilus ATCC 43243 TaxID=483218 RepID=B7AQ01_9FIRM|nr:undecaprenyl-diphosphatase UppP [[Bacteroides] pectinophilus ATCC 43243]MEE0058760.1 undecaprenyl-diphosphate phosphatase [[Bacteroides] pectinophilus]UWN96967.1 undecaprenyl-diphosphate phosphatase [[Bacteroides] pectinophilus]HBH92675.1 undecaprenyl-diphosphate phosphatase [Bacteroides sp.]